MNRDILIQKFLEKNRELNLSAIRDEEGVRIKHIQDSLELEKVIKRKEGMEVADIGTGGGFPLMPLAIMHPECHFVGVDSIKKKTVAVGEILDGIGVHNVDMIRSRAEDIKDKTFDLVTARAVAYSDKLLTWLIPLVKKGGKIALMKQVNEDERNILMKIIKKNKITLEKEYQYQLFEGDINRVIYCLSM